MTNDRRDDQKYVINLLEEEDEKNEHELIKIQLINNSISVNFSQLCKYSQTIREEYLLKDVSERLSQDLQRFQKDYNIDEKNIIHFFELIQKEQISINNDEYFDFCKLSNIYKVTILQKILRKYSHSHSKDIDYIIHLMTEQKMPGNEYLFENDLYSVELEDILGSQIEKCLQNENFKKLPISTVFRIIEKNQDIPISIDLLYDFIEELIEERYILFKFIDIQKLSNEKYDFFVNLYHQRKETSMKRYYEYLQYDFDYVKSMRDEKTSNNEKIESLTNENHEFQTKITDLSDKNCQIENQLNEVTTKNRELKSQNDDLIENDKLKDDRIRLKKTMFNHECNVNYNMIKRLIPDDVDLDEFKMRGIFILIFCIKHC